MTHSWISSGNFIHPSLLRNIPSSGRSVLQSLVSLVLYRHKLNPRGSLYVNPGRQWLSDQTKYSTRSISYGVSALVRRGFITRRQYQRADGSWKTNTYRLGRWLLRLIFHSDRPKGFGDPTVGNNLSPYLDKTVNILENGRRFGGMVREFLKTLDKKPPDG